MRVAVFLVAVMSVTACGDDDGFIGSECRDEQDCFGECVRGEDYPGGVCTVECRDDTDCPGSSFCIERQGGICLPRCDLDRDCRPDYECRDQDREGAPGEATVCIGD